MISFGLGSIIMLSTYENIVYGIRMEFGISSLQANAFGAFMAQVFVFFLVLRKWGTKIFKLKSLYTIFLVVIALCFLFSVSRGAYLSVIIAAFIYILLNKKYSYIPILTVLFIIIFFISPEFVQNRVTENWETESLEVISKGRISLWRGALIYLSENFNTVLFGGGISDFAYKSKLYSGLSFSAYAHNLYLLLMTRGGLMSLSIILLLFWMGIRYSYKNYKYYRDSGENPNLKLFCEASFYVFMMIPVQNFFGERFFNNTGLFFWILLGVNYFIYKYKETEMIKV
jgi:O-antigen ligase